LKDLKVIVNQFYPDLRKCLNTVQLSIREYSYSPSYPNEKVLDIDQSVIVSSQYTSQVINELKTTKDWKKIRQIIADSNVNDYEELYKELYSNMSHYADGREGLVVIILEEYQYHANFRIDKEINIMACIAKIIQTL
jgi:hypothetical protein